MALAKRSRGGTGWVAAALLVLAFIAAQADDGDSGEGRDGSSTSIAVVVDASDGVTAEVTGS